MSSPRAQGAKMRMTSWSKNDPSCMQLSAGKLSPSMFRTRTSNTSRNEATGAGIETLKTPSMFVAICEEENKQSRRARLQQGPVGQPARALAWPAYAAPTEQEQHGQDGAYEDTDSSSC
eukprot:scaffold130118_cov66-Phaeocystis_antarctica.AAC.2